MLVVGLMLLLCYSGSVVCWFYLCSGIEVQVEFCLRCSVDY